MMPAVPVTGKLSWLSQLIEERELLQSNNAHASAGEQHVQLVTTATWDLFAYAT